MLVYIIEYLSERKTFRQFLWRNAKHIYDYTVFIKPFGLSEQT